MMTRMSEATAEAPPIDVLHTFTLADVLPRAPAVVSPTTGGRRRRPASDLARARRPREPAGQRAVAAGVGPGDVILWLGQNSHGILECLLAAAKIGAVCCVANWRQSADEFAFVIDDADGAGGRLAGGRGRRRGARPLERASSTGGSARWLQLDADPADATADSYDRLRRVGYADDPARPVDPAAPVLMLYTAAFLGTPNGAMLSHHAVLTQSLMMAQPPADRPRLRVPELGPAVPRRHLHDDARHPAHRRHQRVHTPGRRRGAVPDHRAPSAAPARSSWRRRSIRSSSSRRGRRRAAPVRPLLAAHVPRAGRRGTR